MEGLPKAILRTLCFADAVGMALSPSETRRLLALGSGEAASLAAVSEALHDDPGLAVAVSEKDGFYALRGSEPLLAKRQEALAVAEAKWLVAGRAIGRLRGVPWLRLVAVCNTVGMGNPRRESDVDVFVVAERGRIWATRLLVHAALAAGSLARRGARIEDRICLSFFVTEEGQDLSRVAKAPDDPYLAVWLATLVPVLDRGGAYRSLLAANRWLDGYLPGFAPRVPAAARAVAPHASARLPAALAEAADRLARALQKPRIMSHPTSRVHAGGTDVVVTDAMLKFHEQDTREAVRAAFLERVARYGV